MKEKSAIKPNRMRINTAPFYAEYTWDMSSFWCNAAWLCFASNISKITVNWTPDERVIKQLLTNWFSSILELKLLFYINSLNNIILFNSDGDSENETGAGRPLLRVYWVLTPKQSARCMMTCKWTVLCSRRTPRRQSTTDINTTSCVH